MGNKLDAILAKPLHSQGTTSRSYDRDDRLHHQPQFSTHQASDHHNSKLIEQTPHHNNNHRGKQQSNKNNESQRIKQRSSFAGSFRRKKGKLNSCPDLLKETKSYYLAEAPGLTSGLREYKSDASERAIDIKIYRSYTDLPQQNDEDKSLKIKVYRKSQESLTNIGRVHSMPRGMNRNESSEFCSTSIESRLSVATQEYNRPPSRRSSSRCSNASSSAVVVNCRASINLDDFPSVETVTKKLSIFEQFFNNLVIKYFKNMTILDQLASICVAIMPDRANQSVSLLQYLQSPDIPADLGRSQMRRQQQQQQQTSTSCASALCPTLPDFLLDEIVEAKFNTPPENQACVCQDLAVKIVGHLAGESACELGRLYEYQLSLVQETIAFRLLAKFAATNVFEAVKSRGKLLDRNSVVSMAINVAAGKRSTGGDPSTSGPKWISVVCFNKELKWNIYDIFRRAALRKDVFACDAHRFFPASPSLSPASVKRTSGGSGGGGLSPPLPPPPPAHHLIGHFSSDRRSVESDSGPWKFYARSDSDPMTYGYRAQLVQWDFVRCCYRLSPNDESNFPEELPWRYDDMHRLYCPYYRLVSDSHLLEYCNWLGNVGAAGALHHRQPPQGDSAEESWSGDAGQPTVRGLEEFVRQFRSGPHVREEIKLVYRSVSGFDQQQQQQRGMRRSDVLVLGRALLHQANDDSTFSTQPPMEILGNDLQTAQRLPTSGGESNQRQAESLRKALAQVTKECDRLCYNLKDMESAG